MMNTWGKIKNLIMCCLILVLALSLHTFVNTVASWLCKITDKDFQSYRSVAFCIAYILYIIIFGIGYYFIRPANENSEKKHYSSLNFFIVIISSLILGFSLQIFTSGVLNIIDMHFPDLLSSYNQMIETSFSAENGALRVITVALLAPIGEELAFRGMGLHFAENVLSGKKSYVFAVLFTALCFGLYHGNVVQFCYAFIIGIVLAVVAIWYESIIPTIIIHISVNTSSYILSVIGIPTSMYTLLMLISLLQAIALIEILHLLSGYTRYLDK